MIGIQKEVDFFYENRSEIIELSVIICIGIILLNLIRYFSDKILIKTERFELNEYDICKAVKVFL